MDQERPPNTTQQKSTLGGNRPQEYQSTNPQKQPHTSSTVVHHVSLPASPVHLFLTP